MKSPRNLLAPTWSFLICYLLPNSSSTSLPSREFSASFTFLFWFQTNIVQLKGGYQSKLLALWPSNLDSLFLFSSIRCFSPQILAKKSRMGLYFLCLDAKTSQSVSIAWISSTRAYPWVKHLLWRGLANGALIFAVEHLKQVSQARWSNSSKVVWLSCCSF